jgi:hypothetical protein
MSKEMWKMSHESCACLLKVSDKYIKSAKEARKMNLIDVREVFADDLCERIELNEAEIAFLDESWLNSIPPLEEGVLRIRNDTYYHFKMLGIDPGEKTFEVRLQKYSSLKYCPEKYLEKKIWGFECTLDVKVEAKGEGNEKGACMYGRNKKRAYELLSEEMLTQDATGWTPNEILFFETVFKPVVDVIYSKDEVSKAFEQDAKIFMMGVTKANYAIASNRPKREKTEAKKGVPAKKAEAVIAPEEERPTKTVRSYGSIRVTSERPPRVPSDKTIRTYKVAAWNARGHVRRYKSGREVYIKPHVCHRVCMRQDGSVAQTVISVRGDATKQGREGQNQKVLA